MKNIINYLNESSNEELINKANYYADIMCISYALQDFYKSMIEGDDEKTLDLMYKISGDVSEYNTKLQNNIKKDSTF